MLILIGYHTRRISNDEIKIKIDRFITYISHHYLAFALEKLKIINKIINNKDQKHYYSLYK